MQYLQSSTFVFQMSLFMQALCIHLGNLSHFLWKLPKADRMVEISRGESMSIAADIESEMYRDGGRLIYTQKVMIKRGICVCMSQNNNVYITLLDKP